ncbi:MAG: hypothetical protein GTO41_23725 [Burkholderiales bacterium]|nr:hypothetical protein [Burkholderiales bacterium]
MILLCVHTSSFPDDKNDSFRDGEHIMEEVVVSVFRSGDRFDIDARYTELLRSRLLKDFEKLRALEEEYEWRQSVSVADSSSRISWGYDAMAELRMRRDTSLTELPIDDTQPATLFRITF